MNISPASIVEGACSAAYLGCETLTKLIFYRLCFGFYRHRKDSCKCIVNKTLVVTISICGKWLCIISKVEKLVTAAEQKTIHCCLALLLLLMSFAYLGLHSAFWKQIYCCFMHPSQVLLSSYGPWSEISIKKFHTLQTLIHLNVRLTWARQILVQIKDRRSNKI